MLLIQLAPTEDNVRSYFNEVKRRHFLPVIFYIAPTRVAPEPIVNCLMTVRDLGILENEDEAILEDWLI